MGLGRQVGSLVRREAIRLARNPGAVIQSVVFPSVLLLVLLAVFGEAVADADGQSAVQRIGPAMLLSGAAFGSVGAAVGMFTDLRSGMLNRLRSMAISRWAPLLAKYLADVVRVLALTVLITLVAVVLGMRFRGGLGPALAFPFVAVGFGSSFVWIGLALATGAATQEGLVPPISALFLLLLFVSRGMVPISAFPGWAQPIAKVTPTSVMVQGLQHLVNGGALRGPLLGGALWATGLTFVFGVLAVNGFRRAEPARA